MNCEIESKNCAGFWRPITDLVVEERAKHSLRSAYQIATQSPDPSTQVGAIILNSKGILLGRGINDFPPNIKVTEDRLKRPLKYKYICHAERSAINDAAKFGYKLNGATMFCPWAACTECAKSIIQSGIKTLVTHKQAFEQGDDRSNVKWNEDILFALELMETSGVTLLQYDGKLLEDDFTVLHSGNLWSP